MDPERPTVLLDHYLKLLKLPTIKREYRVVAAACAKEGHDAIEFLARLCERECLEREQRAAIGQRIDVLRRHIADDVRVGAVLLDHDDDVIGARRFLRGSASPASRSTSSRSQQ